MTCGIKILANKSSIVRLERKLDRKIVSKQASKKSMSSSTFSKTGEGNDQPNKYQ